MLSNLIGSLIELKLDLADKAVEKLPESIRSEVRVVRTEILTCLKDKLSSYIEKNSQEAQGTKDGNLKKIMLD